MPDLGSGLNATVLVNTQDNSLGSHYLDISEIPDPSAPAANRGRIFFDDTDEVLKIRKSGGTVVDLETTGSFAPTSATYVTTSLDGTLSAEKVATAGAGVSLVDTGANGTLTFAQDYIDLARKRVCFFEDCFTDPTTFSGIFDTVVSGTGAAVTATANTETGKYGLWTLDTGTTTTGHANIVAGNLESFATAQGQITIEFLVKFPTLSTAGEEYAFRCGLMDTNGATSTDSINFYYSRLLSGDFWGVRTTNNTVGTSSASTTAVAAGTWYRCKLVINAGGTSVSAFVNGTEINVSPISSNLPASTRYLTFAGHIVKTAGSTARTAVMDYYASEIDLTSSR